VKKAYMFGFFLIVFLNLRTFICNVVRRALDVWGKLPELVILGNKYSPRIPIISFIVKHLQSV
jgi:selenocysteine lyase/cysteine desulfurase